MTQWRRWFWLALCISLLLRLVYAAALPLSNDEAYHWLWTYYPSAGYYDHPGLFAYILWPFTALLGHEAEWIIRIPSLLLMTLCPWAVYFLARDMARDLMYREDIVERCATQAGLLAICLPLYAVLGMYHTGDATVVCVWAWSMLFAYRALCSADGSWKPWFLLGICVGLGCQAKYLFFMFIPLFGACILFQPQFRFWALRAQPYMALAIGFIIFSPNLYWNMQHDWATFVFNFSSRHLQDPQLKSTFEIKHVLEFCLGTLALGLSPGLYLYAMNVFSRRLRLPQIHHCWTFLAVLSLVPMAYFFYRSLTQQVGFHWPAVSYVAILIMAPLHWNASLKSGASTPKKLHKWTAFWIATPIVLMLIIINLALLTVTSFPSIIMNSKGDLRYSSRINTDKINDIYGWDELGEWTIEEYRLFKQQAPCFICGPQYGFVAQLAYYTPTHPHVYLWESHRVHGQHFRLLDDFAPLKGQNALFVAKDPDRLKKYLKELALYFERVEAEPEILDILIGGKVVRQFALIRCYNFSGNTPDWD